VVTVRASQEREEGQLQREEGSVRREHEGGVGAGCEDGVPKAGGEGCHFWCLLVRCWLWGGWIGMGRMGGVRGVDLLALRGGIRFGAFGFFGGKETNELWMEGRKGTGSAG